MPILNRENVLAAETANDVLQPFLSSRRARFAKPQLAKWQVEVVANNQQIGI